MGGGSSLCGLGCDTVALQVNGINVEGLRHSEVVSHIKSRDSEARLLVVDPETDEYFKKLGVTPTEEHTKGESCPCQGDSRVGSQERGRVTFPSCLIPQWFPEHHPAIYKQ